MHSKDENCQNVNEKYKDRKTLVAIMFRNI